MLACLYVLGNYAARPPAAVHQVRRSVRCDLPGGRGRTIRQRVRGNDETIAVEFAEELVRRLARVKCSFIG